MRHVVGPVAQVRAEGRAVVDVGGRRIAVLSVGGEFFAVRDRCPHKGAPMVAGTVSGTFAPSDPHCYAYERHERVLRCPWHGWEFDLESGRSLLEPDRVRLRTFPVHVEDGQVVVEV